VAPAARGLAARAPPGAAAAALANFRAGDILPAALSAVAAGADVFASGGSPGAAAARAVAAALAAAARRLGDGGPSRVTVLLPMLGGVLPEVSATLSDSLWSLVSGTDGGVGGESAGEGEGAEGGWRGGAAGERAHPAPFPVPVPLPVDVEILLV
jgi:hypothetical protein